MAVMQIIALQKKWELLKSVFSPQKLEANPRIE